MALDAIAAISGAFAPTQSAPTASMVGTGFQKLLDAGLAQVDQGLKAADHQVRALASGEEIAPHEVMISMEQARMHLTLLVEIRNRVVEAYQELARMQL